MEFKTQSFTISDLYNWCKSGELTLQPKFQRRKIWKPVAKSYLIDTVLRGLPMPKIYYRMQVDATTVKSVREVVDGQQRLDAIFTYIENGFSVFKAHNKLAGGKTFSKLSESQRSALLSYDISADLLIGVDDAQVLQIFARINSYSLTLNEQEKRNAKYFGPFKQLAYELGTSHVHFWTKHKILTNQSIARMAEAELASELMVAMLAGLQDKKSSLSRYYEAHEETFAQARETKRRFESTISWIDQNVGSILTETVFSRRALFYSLYLAVFDAIYGMPGGEGPYAGFPHGGLDAAKQAALGASLMGITEGIRKDQPPTHLARFANAASRQTDNLQPRKVRHGHLMRVLRDL